MMKTFCIKTNNEDILNYLLNRTKEIDFEDLIYSKNQFKIYQNVIIHYQGKEEDGFFYFLSELITEVILNFYEEKLIHQILGYNYFYFDDYERLQICDNCMEGIENEEVKRAKTRKQLIQTAIFIYVQEHRTMILYEAPHRLLHTLEELSDTLGEYRTLVTMKELTKKYEQIRKDSIKGHIDYYKEYSPKGEFVLAIEGISLLQQKKESQQIYQSLSIEEHMEQYLSQGLSQKDAMKQVAKDRGVSKREIYAHYHNNGGI